AELDVTEFVCIPVEYPKLTEWNAERAYGIENAQARDTQGTAVVNIRRKRRPNARQSVIRTGTVEFPRTLLELGGAVISFQKAGCVDVANQGSGGECSAGESEDENLVARLIMKGKKLV